MIKNFTFSLMLVSFITVSHAQEDKDYASTESEPIANFESDEDYDTNQEFVSSFEEFQIPKALNKQLYMFADFDISSLKEYDKQEKCTYEVDFKNRDYDFKAVYNSAGELIGLTGRYKNVSLPSNIRNDIAKKYPGWTISKNDISYQFVSGVSKIIYRTKLINGKEIKRIKHIDG